MKKYKNLFFDLDGTISESFEGIKLSFEETFAHFGKSVPEEDLVSFVGPPVPKSFARYFPEGTVDEVTAYFRKIYAEKYMFFCKPYAGIGAAVANLKEKGYKIYTGTSKNEEKARDVLAHFGFLHLFDRVYGAGEGRSEKEEVLAYALKEGGFKTEECLLIGDTKYDLYGAKVVGIDCAWVSYGYGTKASVAGFNYVFEAKTPAELMNFL